MALEKQLVDISLQGLDTKTDAKLVAPGKMLELENARFEKTGRVSKRLGSVALTGSPTTARRIHAFGDSVATINTNTTETASVYSPSLSSFAEFGGLAAPMAYIESILSGGSIKATGSAWVNNNIVVIAVQTTAGKALVAWFDVSINEVVALYDTGLTVAANDSIKIISNSGLVLLLHTGFSTNQSLIYEITTTTKTLRATLTTLASSLYSGRRLDMAIDDAGATKYLFVANVDTTSSATIRLWRINLSTWATTSVTWAAASAVLAFAVCAYNGVRVFWNDMTNGISTRTYSVALANTLASTVVVAGTAEKFGLGAKMDSAGIAYLVWQDLNNGAISGLENRSIRYVQVSTAGVASGAVTARTLSVLSKPYVLVQGGATRVFVLGLWRDINYIPSDGQSFVALVEISSSQQARARLLYGVAGIHLQSTTGVTPIADASMPDLHQFGSSAAVFCGSVTSNRQDITTTNPLGEPRNANIGVFNYSTAGMYHAVESNSGLLVTGGYLQTLDATGVRENGYLLYPTITTLVDSGFGGLNAGLYSVVAVLERRDSNGNLVESAVSSPLSITLAAGRKINVTIQSYCVGSQSGIDNLIIYRTVANGSTYYRSMSESVVNNVGNLETTIQTSDTDASIARNAIIYTQGGELDNHQPDGPLAICSDKDRVWVVSGTDRSAVAPSKPFIAGFGTSFMPDVYKSVESSGGPLNALARMGGKTFAFKKQDIFVSVGDGPDVTGSNDTQGEFERLHIQSGALDQSGVVRTNDGVMARGNTGIYTIKSDLSLEYTGAPVEAFNGTSLVGSCFVPQTNEVHFALSDQSDLVYNTEFGQWSRSLLLNANSIANSNGRMVFSNLTAAGGTPGTYAQSGYIDTNRGGANYALRLLTGWIKLSSLQGFMRAYELLILGELKSVHSLQVGIAYDYETTFAETHTITSANATVGSSAYQLRVKLGRQKCESFQVEIQDTSPAGESFNISGLAVLAGMKNGAYRLRAEKTV